jgi:hypothetical protein
MTRSDEGERSTEQHSDSTPQSGQAPPETSGADAEQEHDERDPEVAEIEDDPSRNPDNELLRDIKGG